MPRVKLFDETEVLEKAMHLFWQKGFYATSIQDLVDHLSINRASIYDTYGGKKELYSRALCHYRSINTCAVQQFLEEHADVRSGIKAFFVRAVVLDQSDQCSRGCFIVNATTELLPDDKDTKALLLNAKVNLTDIIQGYLSKGVTLRQISKHKDIESIALLLSTLYSGLKVVTKVSIDEAAFLKSVDTLLALLD